MGNGMRVLKFATIGMGVLILLGTAALIATIVKRGGFSPALSSEKAMPPERAMAAVLDEPDGTGIVGIASVHDRLAVQLRGGGAERVLLIDPATGIVVGRLSLAR